MERGGGEGRGREGGTVWMEDRRLERHFRREEGVFGGESEVGAVETSCFAYT